MYSTSTHKDSHSSQNSDALTSQRKIIHVDMDAFYASVEQRDDPSLNGLPVIVGGQPNGRGVVAACSYEARKFGIHSAMPSAEAFRKCPDGIFVKPRFAIYQQASRQIQAVFQEFTNVVEPLSLDEAYLDVTHNVLFGGSAFKLAREIKAVILERTQLVASAGVSYNKFLAKIASDYDKPDGIYCILPEQGEEFVATLPVGKFHGVGKVTEARMHSLGIHTGADLRRWSEPELESEFGKSSGYYYRVARGVDHRPVRVSRTRKSLGSERTFGQNLHNRDEMLEALDKLSQELLADLADKQLRCTTITVKVRFADFTTFTRAHSETRMPVGESLVKRVVPVLLDRALEAGNQSSRQNTRFSDRVRADKSGIRLLGLAFRGLEATDELKPVQLEIDWD
jgi:DNA polymerase-4